MNANSMFAVCPVLVDRDREIALLERVAATVAGGTPQIVVITGEAGAGKSRLAQQFATSLGEPWREVRLTYEFGVFAAEALGPEPAVALLDGLERLEPVTVAALGVALDEWAKVPLLVLATLRLGSDPRGSERAHAFAQLLRYRFAHELPVPPLSLDGISAMAAALGRDVDPDESAALQVRTGGNPFFVEQLLVAPAHSLSWTLTDAVMSRIENLDDPARAVAELLAVADSPLTLNVVEAVTGGVDGVLSLVDAGLATSDVDGLALRQALVAEVITSRLAPGVRRQTHEQLAHALAREPDASPAVLARHWLAAGALGEAARCATIAADQAAANRAYRTATDLYRIALKQENDDALSRAELLDRAAVAAGWAGAEHEALSWAYRADASYRRAGATWRAIAMWLSPGLSHIPKPKLDEALLARDSVPGVVNQARAAIRERRYDEGAELLRRVMRMAQDTGERHWTTEAGFRLVGAGYVAEATEALQHARATAVASGDDAGGAQILSTLAFVAMACGDMKRALALDRAALANAQRGAESAAWPLQAGLSSLLVFRGEFDEAEQLITRLFEADSAIASEFAQYPACLLDLERGELDSAWARLDRMSAVAALGLSHLTIGVLALRARVHFLSDDPGAALDVLAEADAVTAELFEPTRVDRLVLHARAAATVGDDVALAHVRRSLSEMLERTDGVEFDAAVATVDGQIAMRESRFADAFGHLVDAATRWERSQRLIHAADAWVDAAKAAAAAGDEEGRTRTASRAEEIAQPRGLKPLLARLAVIQAVAVARPADQRLHALTDREREIAQLVATGKTNRQIGEVLFISEHTVRNQLVVVFDKLGVSRRAEVIHLLATPSRMPRTLG